MTRWLVTGASGFVGRALVATLAADGEAVRGASRRPLPSGIPSVQVGALGPDTDWSAALREIDVVVHLAARVHVMREQERNPLEAFREVNVAGTGALAAQAAAAGVRRLVFVSSIKAAVAEDPYGQSKLEAERVLQEVGERRGLQWVVVRPPLVHGPGAGGNLRRLMGLICRGVPLPFGGVKNRRSLVGVENLAALLRLSGTAPQAAGQTLLVADQPAVSTPDLIRMLAASMGRPARLWSVPASVLRGMGWLAGRSEEVERLTGSLEVDDSRTRALLGWAPRRTLEEGLGAMVQAFEKQRLR